MPITRTINISLLEQTPQVRTIRLTPRLASLGGDLLLQKSYVIVTDINGDATINLPVKATGSIRYDYEIPRNGNKSTGHFYVAAGAAIDLDALIAAGGAAPPTVPLSTDNLPEGSVNLYFTLARVLAVALSGVSFATNAAITASDTVLSAFGKLQKQITDLIANKDASGGYAGLTLFKINFKNALNTFTSFFTNSNTAVRTYLFPDKSGTVAMLDDIGSGSPYTYSVANFTELAAAVTAIGTAKANVYITALITIAVDYTSPTNISLNLLNNAGFTVATTKTLTIRGNVVVASPNQFIFQGLGSVIFTDAYPDVLYPEWFGAVGDDRGVNGVDVNNTPTDDYAAIQKTLLAFRNNANFATFSPYAHGGTVKFTKCYYSSQTIRVYVNAEMYGTGGLDYSASRIRFPNNTTGFILATDDRTDAEQPPPYVRTGGNARVRDLLLLGGYSYVADVASVNLTGRTVTAPSAVFNYRTGWAIAEGVVIDGMVWAIESNAIGGTAGDAILPSTTLQLRPFNFTATRRASASELLTDRFSFPASWVGATIEIEGVVNTITAIAAVDSVHSVITLQTSLLDINGNVFAAGYNNFEGRVTAVVSQTKSIMLLKNPGIDLRGVAVIENVAIRGFAGDGIYSGLSDPTTNSSTQPNSSNAIIRNVKADFNRGSGFNVNYANGNVILIEKFNANYNDLYGVSEESQLGNKYTSCHISFSGQNNYVGGLAQTNGSQFDACYMEDGGVPILLGGSTMWLNGTPSRFSRYSLGLRMIPENNGSFNLSALTTASNAEGNYGIYKTKTQIGSTDKTYVFSSFGVSNDAESLSSATGICFHWRAVNFGNNNNPQIRVQLVYGAATQGVEASTVLLELPTSTAGASKVGRMVLPNGFLLGKGAEQTAINYIFPRGEVSKTANYTLTIADDGLIFDNTGAAATVQLTLPASAGATAYRTRFGFFVTAASSIRIIVPGTDHLIGTSGGVAFDVTGGAILGSLAQPEYIEILYTGGGVWKAMSITSGWAA